MKTEERERARELRRRRAMSVKEIARTLGVAPSSVSLCVRDIVLSEEQLESLRLRNPAYNRQLRGANKNAERARARRRAGKLPYGTTRVTVHSTEVVQSIYGAIQEYGGFERPEWLG